MSWETKKCACCGREFNSEREFFSNTSRWMICDLESLWFNCGCNSTLYIPKGKYPWYSPAKHMNPESASVFNKILIDKKIPHMDSKILQIQSKLDTCESVGDVVPEVRRDPLIATQILRIAENIQRANGVESGRGPDLKHAVQILGRQRLKSLLLPAGLAKMEVSSELFQSADFWSEAHHTAMISVLMAKFFNINIDKDMLFLNASLANIGILVNAMYFPEIVDDTIRLMSDPKTQETWDEAGNTTGMYSIRIMGDIAGALWGFSSLTNEVVGNHSRLKISGNTKSVQMVSMVSLALLVSYWIRGKPHLIDQELFQKRLSGLNLEEESVEKFINNTDILRLKVRA